MNLILFEPGESEISSSGSSEVSIFLKNDDPRVIHLKKVLKADVGTEFDAGIVNGFRGRARVEAMDESKIKLIFTPAGMPPELWPLTLILGLSRPQTVKKILREGTALGISRFILTVTDRGEKTYSNAGVLKPDSLRKLFIDGAQQAFSTMLPEAVICPDIAASVGHAAAPGSEPSLVALDNYEAEISLTDYWREKKKEQQGAVLAVGSERGWTGRERDILRKAGYTLASLGPRVLRSETAAVAGAAVCLSGMGLI